MKKKIFVFIEKILRAALFVCSVIGILCALFEVYTIFRAPYPIVHGLLNTISYAFLSLLSAGLSMLLHYDLITKE